MHWPGSLCLPACDALRLCPDAPASQDATKGWVFIGETASGSARVRVLDFATNTVSYLAGTTTKGYAGDGGPATSALISSITSIMPAYPTIYLYDGDYGVLRSVSCIAPSPTASPSVTPSITPTSSVTASGEHARLHLVWRAHRSGSCLHPLDTAAACALAPMQCPHRRPCLPVPLHRRR